MDSTLTKGDSVKSTFSNLLNSPYPEKRLGSNPSSRAKDIKVNEIDVIWKPVVGHHGYEVSSMGDVRNAKTLRVLAKEVHYGKDKKAPYLRVKIRRKNLRINRVVAYAFLGEPEFEGMEVDHLNRNSTDDRVGNLEWVSPSENKRRRRSRQ